jgi:hypothetical protein
VDGMIHNSHSQKQKQQQQQQHGRTENTKRTIIT